MSEEPVVRAAGVRKTYGDTVALDGVSVEVAAGEVFGLVGPNGAGKTTLVRALTGTTRVEGTVSVFGTPPAESDRSRIGLLPQEFAPAGRLTVRELLAYYAGLYDESRAVADVLADVGLTDAADTWYEDLSGGQKRRACVGAALVNDPDLLFLDEPTTGIDPAGRRAVWGLVESLADAGTAVVLTSHSMTEIERLSDRVGLLREGRLVAVGPPAELVADHAGPPRLVIGVRDREETDLTPGADTDRAPGDDAPDAVATDTAASDTTATDTAPTDPAAEALRAADFAVAVGDGEVAVEGVGPDEIAAIVDTLEAASVDYESLTWAEPGLEDAYLRLTGETFAGLSRPGASAVAATGVDAAEGDPAANDTSDERGDVAGGGDDAAEEVDA
ncbi:ABC transporter ATP-binding protein [Halobaculum sp. MBLA0147]|uniref:ABC transporter ATP-binding protein n=1 Tax=Halobaculum sp. MBLA0147 TaxID=3079934 RepID=UPI00352531E0